MSLIPIGPAEPREQLKMQHVGPREAIQIHNDVHSRLSVGIHWGTFNLGIDSPTAPRQVLLEELQKSSIPPSVFRTLSIGDIVEVPSVVQH